MIAQVWYKVYQNRIKFVVRIHKEKTYLLVDSQSWNHTVMLKTVHVYVYGKCSKISNTKKRKNTLYLFSLLTSEAKGINTFFKGRQFNCFPLQVMLKTVYYKCLPLQNVLPPSEFLVPDIFLFDILKDFTVQIFRTLAIAPLKLCSWYNKYFVLCLLYV